MTEDAAIAIDRTTLQSVHTCTQPRMDPAGVRSTEPILPWEVSVVTVPSCIRPSKRPPQKGRHQNCKMPPCGHTGVALRGWSHLHLSSTDTLLSSWQVWFRTCRAQLGPNPTIGGVVCTKVLSTSWSTRFQSWASSYPPNASKTPTHKLHKLS
jgi:hypothetical protein